MKLSNSEKLILVMLCEIYEKLGIKGEIDPDFVKSAIYSGNTWGLDWQYSGLVNSDDAQPAIREEVVDILDMWSFIEDSYSRLSGDDQARVETEAAPFGKNPRFGGFDGNNESDHIGVARFLIEDLGRFSGFKNRELNSHMPSLDGHRRMYGAFKAIRHTLTGGLMGPDSLIAILKERIHPSQR